MSPLPELYTEKIATRFWKKVAFGSSCWHWQAHRHRTGYGQFRVSRAYPERLAHRISWQLCYGQIPPGLYVLHKCDNPPCVNPTHLFLGSNADNLQDAVKKGRKLGIKGEANKQAKISNNQASEIREQAPFSPYIVLARKYGISSSEVGYIARGKRHLSTMEAVDESSAKPK